MVRWYNPQIGRFITPDTIVQSPGGNPQTLNRYSYCGNNPVNHIDPTGHSFWKKVGNFFKQWGGTILSVAFTFIGMPFIGAIISSAFSAFVNGGSFGDFAIGMGVGFAAGFAGGGIAGKIGNFFDMNKAGLGLAALRGGLSGSIGGAGSAAIYHKDIGRGAWMGGALGAGVGGGAFIKITDISCCSCL
ncbi:MAG: RHS repeat-associated core domain-containing protein, partial [Candidatus Omnitrophica bacterium]|nr:RHS repeat-associated core domain-containing protein [Candidatus Omnitrophota bacterium]